MKKYLSIIFIVFSTSIFAQGTEQVAGEYSGWGIYGGIQSMDIIDKSTSDEDEGHTVHRLDEFYIGFFKNTDFTIGILPVKIGVELGHRGTASRSKAYEFPLDTNPLGLHHINDVDILITYLNLSASANWLITDRFNLEIGPMFGINLDSEVIVYYTDKQGEDRKISSPLEYDEDDYGIILGAGYLLNERTFINFGIYHGLKDHEPGRFNNIYLNLGLSF